MFNYKLRFFALCLLLTILSYNYPIFYVFLLLYYLIIFKQDKLLLKTLLIFGLLFFCYYHSFRNQNKMVCKENELVEIKIKEIKNNYYIAKINQTKAIFYSKNKYKINDIVKGYYEEIVLEDVGIDLVFNYKTYLDKQGIKNIFSLKEEKLLKKGYSIFNYRYDIYNYFNKKFKEKTSKYLSCLILGINDLDEDIYNSYLNFNLSHLFAISGLHIMILIKYLNILLKKLKCKNKIIDIFLVFYLILLNFIPSVFRAISTKIFKDIFKIDSLDAFFLSFIIFILISPKSFFLPSFYLSYLISFLIYMCKFLSKKHFKIKLVLLINILVFPLIINLNNNYNLLSMPLSLLYTELYGFLIIPLSIILLIIPSLEFIYIKIVIILENILSYLKNYNFFNFSFSNFSILEMIFYYFFFFLFMYKLERKNKKANYFLFLLIFLIVINSLPNYIFKSELYFLNVGQGDSAIYINSKNKCNMVFDSYKNTYSYLLKKGIKNLDYIILSHGHRDHILDIDLIIKNIKVDNILVSKYDYSKEIVRLLNKYKNVKRVESEDCFKCGDAFIKILAPYKNFEDLNDVSIVFKMEVKNTSFLFTGDISSKIEDYLINRYKNYLKSDYLKVAHHGSNTSTSKRFLNYVKPKVAYISVGLNNSHNLPNKEVIDNLNSIKDLEIYISYKRKSLKIIF